MDTQKPEYTSFLVRLWREPPGSDGPSADGREWLVQVEHIPSGKKEYLASLDDLFAFIRGQLPGPHTDRGGERRGNSKGSHQQRQPATLEGGDASRNNRF